jgi:hypothetical protein
MAKWLGVVLGIVCLLLPQAGWADATADVKAVFERFIAAQNVRDMETLKGLLLDTPSFLWVVRGTPVWGRDEALQGFEEQCHGAFYLDPGMAEFKTIELSGDVVQLYAPAVFIPPPVQQPQPPFQVQQMRPEKPPPLPRPAQVQQLPPEKFIISQTLVKTSAGWRIWTILSFPINPMPPGRQPLC